MIQPVIQSYMVRLWYQQQHVMHEDRAVGTGKLGTEEGQASNPANTLFTSAST
jgi:hypothetical protein